jgi:hypothetical protein
MSNARVCTRQHQRMRTPSLHLASRAISSVTLNIKKMPCYRRRSKMMTDARSVVSAAETASSSRRARGSRRGGLLPAGMFGSLLQP